MTPYLTPLHTVYVYTVYFFTQRRGGGRGRVELTREKVRGAIVHKAGRKYQHDLLYLQSINYITHQERRHLGFGVFIVIQSMHRILVKVFSHSLQIIFVILRVHFTTFSPCIRK
jgi:hypothetical protein